MIRDYPIVLQEEDYDCGWAAVDALCRYYGKGERGPAKLANRVQGMAPDTVQALLHSLGFSVLSGRMTLPVLRALTRAGTPVLCPVNRFGGHWVTVTGVRGNRVYVSDPEDGRREYTLVGWNRIWRDVSASGQPFLNWGIAAWTQ